MYLQKILESIYCRIYRTIVFIIVQSFCINSVADSGGGGVKSGKRWLPTVVAFHVSCFLPPSTLPLDPLLQFYSHFAVTLVTVGSVIRKESGGGGSYVYVQKIRHKHKINDDIDTILLVSFLLH